MAEKKKADESGAGTSKKVDVTAAKKAMKAPKDGQRPVKHDSR